MVRCISFCTSLDVAGLDRIINLMRLIERWDVLCITTSALLHAVLGMQHALLAVVFICGIDALDRDLVINEVTAALYLLQHTCGTVQLPTVPGYFAALLTIALSLWSRSSTYLRLGHVERRGCLLLSYFSSVLIYYPWHDGSLASVVRLAMFVLSTRYGIVKGSIDPWDISVQYMWIFVVPVYVCGLLPITAAVQWYGVSAKYRRSATVWTTNGVCEEAV